MFRSVLGDAAVPIPAIDLGPAFAAAANAALNMTYVCGVLLWPPGGVGEPSMGLHQVSATH